MKTFICCDYTKDRRLFNFLYSCCVGALRYYDEARLMHGIVLRGETALIGEHLARWHGFNGVDCRLHELPPWKEMSCAMMQVPSFELGSDLLSGL